MTLSEALELQPIWGMPDTTVTGELPMIPYSGSYRTCAVCGKKFFVFKLDDWVYKKSVYNTKKRRSRDVIMCSWSCKRKYEADHPDKRRHIH